MKIFRYRKQEDYNSDPWENGLITGDTQLDDLRTRSIIDINGQTILRNHASTYITGRNTCLAHHFAKMLAAAVLQRHYEDAPSLKVNMSEEEQGNVLWIDSVRGIHACAEFFNEMIAKFDPEHKHFSLLCIDKLGSFRYDFYALIHQVEEAIKYTKPSLIVIDDIDHLMPYCGINAASAFLHTVRDTLNHHDTACLFIGYNHLGKRASTTGNLGNLLFPAADNVFSVTTQQAITKVKLVRSFIINAYYDNEFLFTVDNDNMPHELVRSIAEINNSNFIQHNTLKDIFGQVIKPGQTISPDELCDKLINRKQQLNRLDRTRTLIAQAAQLGIIHKADPNSNDYTLNHTAQAEHDTNLQKATQPTSDITQDADCTTKPNSKQITIPQDRVNNSLTLPPPPNTVPYTVASPPSSSTLCGEAHTHAQAAR